VRHCSACQRGGIVELIHNLAAAAAAADCQRNIKQRRINNRQQRISQDSRHLRCRMARTWLLNHRQLVENSQGKRGQQRRQQRLGTSHG